MRLHPVYPCILGLSLAGRQGLLLLVVVVVVVVAVGLRQKMAMFYSSWQN